MPFNKTHFPHLALSIFIAFSFNACDSKPLQTDKVSTPQVRPAKLLTITASSTKDFLNYPAIIKSQELSALSFGVSGKVKAVEVVEAQQVKKGDLLAKLDQRTLLAKITSAKAQFKNADEEYQRALRLIKEDAISRSELQQRKSQYDVSKSQLDTAQKTLQDSVLVAPFDGVISTVSIKKHQIVQVGKPALSILGDKGFEAVINLPSHIVALAKEQKTEPKDTYIVLSVAPSLEIPIKFKKASLSADASSQTYEITFTFDKVKDLNILPGMNATVWFRDPTKLTTTDKVTVPLTAIGIDGEKKYVWVVDLNTMKVSKRDIVLDISVGANVVVNSGLELGETIVSAGISSLSNDMKVSIWSTRN